MNSNNINKYRGSHQNNKIIVHDRVFFFFFLQYIYNKTIKLGEKNLKQKGPTT